MNPVATVTSHSDVVLLAGIISQMIVALVLAWLGYRQRLAEIESKKVTESVAKVEKEFNGMKDALVLAAETKGELKTTAAEVKGAADAKEAFQAGVDSQKHSA